MNQNAFTLASREWYEVPERYVVSPDFSEEITAHLPPTGWRLHRSDIWLHVDRFVDRIPPQGFKVHVSSIPECSRNVLALITTECVVREMSFKCTAGPELLGFQNGKNRDRGGGGKFITIYPPDDRAFMDLLEGLYERTKDKPFVGPYILSDRPYKDSKILFYRYGSMNVRRRLQPDGTRVGVLVGPGGEEVEDQRQPFFVLPSWVDDPFVGVERARAHGADTTVIGDTFEITAMIAASNRGCVYEAIDLGSGETVVVKEARPHVNRTTLGGATIDSQSLLQHEYDVLKHLEDLPWTPRPIRLFKDWEHLFLAQEKVPGLKLRAAIGRPEHLWLPYVRRKGELEAFLPKFCRFAGSLLEAVQAIHDRGVVISDLSTNNVIVNTDTWSVRLIDFEGAIRLGEDEHLMPVLSRWITPGFVKADRLTSGVVRCADDYYAASRVLLSALLPTAGLSDLNPGCHGTSLDFLLGVGVPEWVADVIAATAEGDLISARAALGKATT